MFIFFIALLVITITFFFKNYRQNKDYPPGPLRFPLFGSWYSVPAVGIENKISEWKKKYGNIIGLKMGNRNLVIITGHKEIVSALKNDNFQNRMHIPAITEQTFFKILGLFFGDGEQYFEARRFTLRYLGHVSSTKLEPVMHKEMLNFFSSIKSGETVEVNSAFVDFAINTILVFLVGDVIAYHRKEIDTFRKLAYLSFKTGRVSGIETFYPLLRIIFSFQHQSRALSFAKNFFQERLDEHRKSFDPENIRDYIDAFLVEQENEKQSSQVRHFTDEELITCLTDLTKAASESTGNTAAFVLLYVALHPEVQKKIHKELDDVLGGRLPKLEDKMNLPYCDAVMYETFRISTIAPISVPHVVTQETNFNGYTLPTGTVILFPFSDIFLDRNEFDKPNDFNPDRFLSKAKKSKIISFGLGKRSCVGELIAKNSLFFFITYFFQKYSISLPKGHACPSTVPELGFTNSPKPFKIIIEERF